MAVGVATGDEDRLQTPQGTVWSCRVVGESFDLIQSLAAAPPRAKTTEHLAGFSFGADRQGALANTADISGTQI